MDWFPHESFRKVPADYLPQIELELLNNSNGQHAFLRRRPGGGKTSVVQKYIRNQTLKDDSFAISFVHSRALGEVQKEKFHQDSLLLNDTLSQCFTYFHGDEEENRRIRDGKTDFTLLITTPFMFAGSLTSFSPMIGADHKEFLATLPDLEAWQGVFSSTNPRWAGKLASASIVFIDEVDSYPLPLLLCLATIVRLLLWRNPTLQVILSSGTVTNPDDFARLFFGPKADYLDLTGNGRRGTSRLNVYYEEEPEAILHEWIQAIKTYIQDQITALSPGDAFAPKKVILFLNNKLQIDIRKIIGDFSEFFVTIHGNMSADLISDKMRQFRQDPRKICLVTTKIVQSGLDLPDITWGISYGLPPSLHEYIQLRCRINRTPGQLGRIDIILRSTNAFEKTLATPEKRKELQTFIFEETPPPIPVPRYSLTTLKYAIALGAVFGLWDVLEYLEIDVVKEYNPFYAQDLSEAYLNLLLDGVIALAPEGGIRPTKKTKQWVFDFPTLFDSDVYSVILQEKRSKTRKLGTISLPTVLRHHLPSQGLPFIDDSYVVQKVDPVHRKIFVTSGVQELYYFRNKLDATYTITGIFALEPARQIALIELEKEERVIAVDSRTKLQSGVDNLSHRNRFLGVFLKRKVDLAVKTMLTHVYATLNLDPSYIRQKTCFHEELGEGTVLIDTTNLSFATMIYYRLLTHKDGEK